MAIVFDASSQGTSASSPLQWNHTGGSGSDRIVWVAAWLGTADDVSATYDGVSMTLATKFQGANDSIWHYLWYLVAPPSGSKQVSVSGTVSYGVTRGAAISYTGADQSSVLDGVDGDTASLGSQPSLDSSVTTTVDDDWMVSWGRKALTDTVQSFSGATTERLATGNGTSIGDSAGSLGAAGSKTSTFNSNSGNEPLTQIVAAFKPAGGGGGGNPWYARAQQ